MVESFLIPLAGISGSFPEICLDQLFHGELLAPASARGNSLTDTISGISQNFIDMQS